MQLANALSQNCGPKMHCELASRSFTDSLLRLANERVRPTSPSLLGKAPCVNIINADDVLVMSCVEYAPAGQSEDTGTHGDMDGNVLQYSRLGNYGASLYEAQISE